MNFDENPDFTLMTRREVEDFLIERAMVDAEFRSRLLTNAADVLKELGLPIGTDVKIRVLEEEPKSFYIVLPRVLRKLEELDEEELDDVSGGVGDSDAIRFFKGYA